jgi:hypothetical protein
MPNEEEARHNSSEFFLKKGLKKIKIPKRGAG